MFLTRRYKRQNSSSYFFKKERLRGKRYTVTCIVHQFDIVLFLLFTRRVNTPCRCSTWCSLWRPAPGSTRSHTPSLGRVLRWEWEYQWACRPCSRHAPASHTPVVGAWKEICSYWESGMIRELWQPRAHYPLDMFSGKIISNSV